VLGEESLGAVATDRQATGEALFLLEFDGIYMVIDQGMKYVQGIFWPTQHKGINDFATRNRGHRQVSNSNRHTTEIPQSTFIDNSTHSVTTQFNFKLSELFCFPLSSTIMNDIMHSTQ